MKNAIAMRFENNEMKYKSEIEKRAAGMRLSVSKYCIAVLVNHISSGQKLTITEEDVSNKNNG
jgi:hypothetical protein